MLTRILSFFAILTLWMTTSFAQAAEPPKDATPAAAPALTDQQKLQVEDVVRQLLVKEPSLIMKAAEAYQKQQSEEADKKAKETIGSSKDKLYNDPNDAVMGNPKGDVVIVEFFDFNCGYCKKAATSLRKLVEEDKNVKIVFKEYPILAESSTTAAKAALAANKQGKYVPFHMALMEHKGALSEDAIMEVAGSVGLNKDQLKKDMASPEIAAHITASQSLGRDVGARGTPTFIIADKIVPGAMEVEEMKAKIAEVRQAAKK
jgi:protein-disulfide isomerase